MRGAVLRVQSERRSSAKPQSPFSGTDTAVNLSSGADLLVRKGVLATTSVRRDESTPSSVDNEELELVAQLEGPPHEFEAAGVARRLQMQVGLNVYVLRFGRV